MSAEGQARSRVLAAPVTAEGGQSSRGTQQAAWPPTLQNAREVFPSDPGLQKIMK